MSGDDELDHPIAQSPATLRPPRHPHDITQQPLLSFGVLSDIQLASIPWRYNYNRTEKRHYRESAQSARSAVAALDNVAFNVHCGDLVDGVNSHFAQEESALRAALDALNADHNVTTHHALGNHDHFLFDRQRWRDELHLQSLIDGAYNLSLRTLPKRNIQCAFPLVLSTDNTALLAPIQLSDIMYYDFTPHPHIRMIILDSYDISMFRLPLTHRHRIAAKTFLTQHNPTADATNTGDVSDRFVGYNGGIGHAQLLWLDTVLTQCDALSQRAIIASHVPLHPRSALTSSLCLNYEDVINVLTSHHSTTLCLSGHDHRGGYAHDNGIHYVTMKAVLSCPPGRCSYARVDMFTDHMNIVGVDLMQSYSLPLRSW